MVSTIEPSSAPALVGRHQRHLDILVFDAKLEAGSPCNSDFALVRLDFELKNLAEQIKMGIDSQDDFP